MYNSFNCLSLEVKFTGAKKHKIQSISINLVQIDIKK